MKTENICSRLPLLPSVQTQMAITKCLLCTNGNPSLGSGYYTHAHTHVRTYVAVCLPLRLIALFSKHFFWVELSLQFDIYLSIASRFCQFLFAAIGYFGMLFPYFCSQSSVTWTHSNFFFIFRFLWFSPPKSCRQSVTQLLNYLVWQI